ncbi:MAG: hypothetical protein K2I56_00955 [Muribaculaceae bacterium]|nr:hypothetical protein [Muribaculaceae bacterium]
MIKELPEEQRLSAYKAVMDYQFTHEPLPDDFPAELRQAVMETVRLKPQRKEKKMEVGVDLRYTYCRGRGEDIRYDAVDITIRNVTLLELDMFLQLLPKSIARTYVAAAAPAYLREPTELEKEVLELIDPTCRDNGLEVRTPSFDTPTLVYEPLSCQCSDPEQE